MEERHDGVYYIYNGSHNVSFTVLAILGLPVIAGRKRSQEATLTSQTHRSIATSISSSSVGLLQEEFGVSRTVALLPLTLYVVALGLGPVIGGPLSETIGRYPVIMGGMLLGAFFTIGAGFVHNFGALCFFRFLTGFLWAPVLANAPGSLAETFMPKTRGPVSAVFILTPFLGPGLG